MLDTWLEIVPTDRRVPAGAMTAPAELARLAALKAETRSTASTSNSCKNSAAAQPVALHLHASKPALVPTITTDPAAVMRSPGSVALPAVLLLGAAVTTTRAMIAIVVTATVTVVVAVAVVLLLGLAIATVVMTTEAVTMEAMAATAAVTTMAVAAKAATVVNLLALLPVPLPVPLPGISLPEPRTATVVTVDTRDTVLLLAWPHRHLASLRRLLVPLVLELPQVWLVASTHSSSSMPEAPLPRLLRTMLLLRLPATNLPHLPLVPEVS
ncbi:uncharacterized protein BDZ83DRAFT_54187 [Colletotrichum acutatum]|uniref:Uncharacterized protein n=1 Tax=Glomerella acutata TaxID=27357 RepID=A0AAD8UGS2_GLOAC|nr:uncharacterized protein BDZ83DRAFT_54187 [Colletotrichum acutatum]KAK1715566.1 hypothetical protein BDZ83DRAFT_54187 [Colletotrichum acutatum]